MDVLASNDGRLPHQKIERIRHLRPDMVLLSGGTDGGTVSHVVELAEFIAAADPRPRFGAGFRLPVIFAGNKDARENVREVLGDKTALKLTDNIRPLLERENLGPARQVIHDLLPGTRDGAGARVQEAEWNGRARPSCPHPERSALLIETVARRRNINVVGV